jgi:hypothetical protein
LQALLNVFSTKKNVVTHSFYCINFKELTQKEVDAFARELQAGGASKESLKTLNKIQTRDALVKYLAKAIPCSC